MILNRNQNDAVSCDENICVVACPGSGKTRTIVAKLLKCIEEVRNTSRQIACITYTHAAVDEIEMRLREHGTIGDDEYYEVGTIHSFCLTNILQPFHYMLDELKAGFEVISPDSEEWQTLVQRLAEMHGVGRLNIDAFANVHRKPDHTLFVPPELPDEAAIELVLYLDEHALVSLSDIVYHSSRLVENVEFIPRGLGSRFAWMIVDEFQDTSDGQVFILSKIARHNKTKFFLVGDPNQSIMSFAGAHPELMPRFADEIGARTDVALYGNYRSSQLIVSHAERLIPTTCCMIAIGKFRNFPVEPERIHVDEPVAGIIDHFLPEVERYDIPIGEAAVLAPWWLPLYHVGRQLRERGVPVIGPGARPYRRTRLFASLAEHLCAYAEDRSPDLFRACQRSLFMALLNITGIPEWRAFTYDGRKCLCRIVTISKELGQEFKTGVETWLRTVSGQIAGLLIQNEFLPQKYGSALSESAEDMILDMERNGVDIQNLCISDLGLYARPRECLQLVTMHSSKGREYDAVAIIDLHEGRVPHFSCNTQEQCDEARRQLYVAITRARKLLMYFTDSSHGRNRPSRFLLEMGLA